MANYWVSGCAGFLGSHLCEALLAQGHNVYGNDSLICGDESNVPESMRLGLEWFRVDCNQLTVMQRTIANREIDVLIHTAATAAEGFSVFSPHFITKNIAEASVATFSAAIGAGVKRIVTMSSMSRYGKGTPPFTEDDATAPVDPYAAAKVYAETQLKILCETHGVKWAIAVPHNIIGTRQEISAYRNVCSIFLNRLKMDMPVYIYGDGEQMRCFSPVQDCIPSIIRMVHGDADGEVVNIGPDGGEITINELLEICELVTGKIAERVYLPPRPVTDNVTHAYCSSDKARRLLGYEPKQSLKDCIWEMSKAMVPQEFVYGFPIEIDSPMIPRTWKEKL